VLALVTIAAFSLANGRFPSRPAHFVKVIEMTSGIDSGEAVSLISRRAFCKGSNQGCRWMSTSFRWLMAGQFRRFHALPNVAAALMRRFYNSVARYRRREHAWFGTDNNVLDGDVERRSKVLLAAK
jgi:hypothetical protein